MRCCARTRNNDGRVILNRRQGDQEFGLCKKSLLISCPPAVRSVLYGFAQVSATVRTNVTINRCPLGSSAQRRRRGPAPRPVGRHDSSIRPHHRRARTTSHCQKCRRRCARWIRSAALAKHEPLSSGWQAGLATVPRAGGLAAGALRRMCQQIRRLVCPCQTSGHCNISLRRRLIVRATLLEQFSQHRRHTRWRSPQSSLLSTRFCSSRLLVGFDQAWPTQVRRHFGLELSRF